LPATVDVGGEAARLVLVAAQLDECGRCRNVDDEGVGRIGVPPDAIDTREPPAGGHEFGDVEAMCQVRR
jgi:hypothetical protein